MIEARDVASIYEVPHAYHAAGLDREVLAAFGIEPAPKPDMSRWNAVIERVSNPEGEVTIAIVGKYTGLKDAYKSLTEALCHGGMANRVKVHMDWIESKFSRRAIQPLISSMSRVFSCPAVLASAARRARFLPRASRGSAKCLISGSVLGCRWRSSRRSAPCGRAGGQFQRIRPGEKPVVGLMTEWMRGNELEIRAAEGDLGGTMRLGAYRGELLPGSKIAGIYGKTDISERHRHRYEVNTAYRERLAKRA